MEEVYIRGNIYIYGLVYWFIVFSGTFKFNNISVKNIVAVSFIGGGNQSTQRKPPICRKSLTKKNFMTNYISNTVNSLLITVILLTHYLLQ